MSNIFISIIFIAIGGAIGAETRFWTTGKLKHLQPLPYGTLFVNVTGSFLLGLFLTLTNFISIQAEFISFIGTGFFGCYTTMSSFAVETMTLQEQSNKLAIINITLMITTVLLGAFIGKGLALLVH